MLRWGKMRTAIDSSALWSIFKGEADARLWVDLLVSARRESELVVCDIVFAEIAPLFPDLRELDARLTTLGIEFDPINSESAFLAGQIFREYREKGGPRTHLIPDFLVAAHALNQADRLAAPDRGYLRRYFPSLKVLDLPPR
jgi:predicted nucleic acid-binding protein